MRSVEQLTTIIESMPTAIIMVNGEGRVELVNAQAERIFGYAADELIGQKIDILVPIRFRRQHPDYRAGFIKAPNARPMGAGRDLFGLRKDGSEFPIEIGLSPVTTEEKRFVLSTIVDISERQRQAAKLQQANEALERSNIELQRFAHVASHDLQTPMRSIASFVELLQITYEDRLDEQGKDWINRTIQSIHHLQNLVRDLLSYSRVDAQMLPFKRVSMQSVVSEALSLLDMSLRESGAEVSCDDLPPVMGDHTQLVQLLQNLIANAIKYRGKEPPKIKIFAIIDQQDWVFAVSDNGIGIAPKHYEKIFEIFQRLHNQKEYPGTGIGLAVCRRVVNRHDGRIWVESELGQGSVFYFTIPKTMENMG